MKIEIKKTRVIGGNIPEITINLKDMMLKINIYLEGLGDLTIEQYLKDFLDIPLDMIKINKILKR